jgi:soluble lytic murein transglycosylase
MGTASTKATKSPDDTDTAEINQATPESAINLKPWFAGERAYRLFKARQWRDAAEAFDVWIHEHAEDARIPRANLLAGISRLYASQPAAATIRLEKAAEQIPEIESSIRLFLAEAAGRMNKPSAVVRNAKLVPSSFAQRRRLDILTARALRLLGKKKASRQAYTALVESPKSSGAILEEAAEAYEGADVALHAKTLRRIIAVSPHTKRAIRAERKLKSLPKRHRHLRNNELLIRLENLIDNRRYRSAIKTGTRLRKTTKTGSADWCAASRLLARALEKSKSGSRAAPIYAAAIRRCKKQEAFPALLYFGGKRATKTGDNTSAIRWWKALVKQFPAHRYTDDALVHLAEQARKAGENQEADKYLLHAIQVGGDMQEKAAWKHFWVRWEAKSYSAAAQSAEQAIAVVDKRQQLVSRGRLVYWQGRSLERAGNTIRAALVYARLMREFPLGWYSLIAHERLRRIDPKAAMDTSQAAKNAPQIPTIVSSGEKTLEAPSIKAAIELIRLGLISHARAELDHTRPKTTEADWIAALLYDRIGEHTKSYRIARWKHPEHTSIWPTSGQAERWKLANPRPPKFRRWVQDAAKSNGIDESYIWAVIQTESAFRTGAVSFADAVGLMQLIEPTGQAMAKRLGIKGKVNKRRLREPELNIRLGSHFLKRLSSRFSGHPALMAAAYNAGPGRPKKWTARWPGIEIDAYVEKIPFRETRRYVKSVVTAWMRYRALYQGADTSISLTLPKS